MSTALLEGIRVVDLGGEAIAAAGRTLVDLGAEVILVEPPGGGPGRRVPPLIETAGGELSGHFLATAVGKLSVTARPGDAVGHSLVRRLLSTADVVLVTDGDELHRSTGMDVDELRAALPSLVVTSLTPYGRSGPHHRWRGSDLTAWAASGGMPVIGEADRAPLAPGGRLAYGAGCLNAAAGTVIALLSARRTGKGQLVDISLQESVLSVTGETGPYFALEGILGAAPVRVGRRRGPAQGMFATSDGLVEILPFMPGQWDALARWIADDLGVEEATMDVFRGSVQVRAPFGELIDGWVERLAAQYTKQEFLLEAQRRAIPCGAVNEPSDLLGDAHLRAVDAWGRVAVPGVGPVPVARPPLRIDGERAAVGPVPRPGEHDEQVWAGLA